QEALRARCRERGWSMDSTHDLARVLRLPGTVNRKLPDNPVPVTVLEAAWSRVYDVADFEAALSAAPGGETADTGIGVSSLRDRELALSALAGLSPSLAVNYRDWLLVGMALHSVDPSDVMLAEWDKWSRNCLDKYKPGTCAVKWATFGKTGRGIGSL